MKQGLFSNLLLSIVSLIFVLAVLEVGLRIYGYEVGAKPKDSGSLIFRASEHPDVRFEATPGSSALVWGEDVTISSRGLREPEPAAAWDPDHRVIVLGDSIAFGNFLAVESTFARQLQMILLSEDRDIEILNFAVGGYDTIQEVASFEHRGRPYRPDLVVVAYCLNDAGIVSMNLAHFDLMDALENNPLFRLRTVQLATVRLKRLRLKLWSLYKNNPVVFHRKYADKIDPIGDDEEELLALGDRAFKLRFRLTSEYGRYGKSLQGAATGRFHAARAARGLMQPRAALANRAAGGPWAQWGLRGIGTFFVSYGSSPPAD